MARRRVTVKRRRRVGFSTKGRFWFDKDAAAAAVEFIETFCTHVKGELAGEPLELRPDERWMVEELFGWKRKDAAEPGQCTRQYRALWYEVPRKNNKTTLAAAIALVLTFLEPEPGGEVYSAAADKDQARLAFNTAKAMVTNEPELASRSATFKDSIVAGKSGTAYKPVSADAETKHGYNASGLIVDEVHVHRTRDLIDTLRTSVGSRRQPLEVYITTAGVDRTSICWEMHQHAVRVIDGTAVDDALLPVIYGATLKDDWKKPEVWRRANPGFGSSVKEEYIRAECERAKSTPGYQNAFKRLHLNIWTNQRDLWLDVARWESCQGEIDLKALAGRRALGGLDLSSTTDLSAFLLAFDFDTGEREERDVTPAFSSRSERLAWFEAVKDGQVTPERVEVPVYEYVLLPFFWMPEENVRERVERDAVPYDEWIRDGWVKTTLGNIVDYDVIRRDINDLGDRYDIAEIAIDRWNATHITTQLAGDGFTVFWHGQGFASMGQPTRDFEAFVRAKRIRHGAHPTLDWMAGNVAVDYDPAGYPKPNKAKSTERIDGIVAAIMALGRCLVHESEAATEIGEDYEVMMV